MRYVNLRLIFDAIFVLIVCGASFAQVESGGCLSYEPARVTLHGKLVSRTFPGPPNYTNVRKGDQAETYWILNLDSPRCVNEGKAEPGLNLDQKNIKQVQLVLEPEMYQRYKNMVGKRVLASGTLFGAENGHHHTPVLLTVSSIGLPHWK